MWGNTSKAGETAGRCDLLVYTCCFQQSLFCPGHRVRIWRRTEAYPQCKEGKSRELWQSHALEDTILRNLPVSSKKDGMAAGSVLHFLSRLLANAETEHFSRGRSKAERLWKFTIWGSLIEKQEIDFFNLPGEVAQKNISPALSSLMIKMISPCFNTGE